MTLEQLAERIRQLNIAEQPNTAVLIEVILPKVFHKVLNDAIRDENELNAFRSNHTLSITSGVVSCPIREEFAESVIFLSAPLTSYSSDALDFSNGSSLFDKFRVDSGNIHYRQAGLSAGIFTGVKTINAITIPSLPTLASDTVDLTDDLIQEVIKVAGAVIKGEIPLASL